MSAAEWYWREGPLQHGPITWEKLQSLSATGKIAPNDWVMCDGWSDWKLACEVDDPGENPVAVGPLPAPPALPLPTPRLAALPPPEVAARFVLQNTPPAYEAAPMTPADPAPLANVANALHEPARTESVYQPAQRFNVAAMAALAASMTGLLFLAFELGLVGAGLGGWCLCAASVTGRSNGKGLALAAVVIGAVNVVFRVMCATINLGLTHM